MKVMVDGTGANLCQHADVDSLCKDSSNTQGDPCVKKHADTASRMVPQKVTLREDYLEEVSKSIYMKQHTRALGSRVILCLNLTFLLLCQSRFLLLPLSLFMVLLRHQDKS